MTRRTDQLYETELRRLREDLLLMGILVESLLASVLEALACRDGSTLQRLFHEDDRIDALEVQIDEQCVQLLARRQPMASDLRFITVALKAVTDLERMGDLCTNICSHASALLSHPAALTPPGLRDLGQLAQRMARGSLDALLAGDVIQAREVIANDALADALHSDILAGTLAEMRRAPERIERTASIQVIAKCLERIADHATNIAEHVVFLVHAQDIRHAAPGQARLNKRPM